MYKPYQHDRVADENHFYAVTCISNPCRYKSRYELYHRFKRRMEEASVKLMTVELALGERSFEVTRPDDSMNVQLRSRDEIWHKENLLNIGISRLPTDWRYVAWLDADIEFLRDDWVEETVHQLQRYQVVQMFAQALDMGSDGTLLKAHDGFAYSWLRDGLDEKLSCYQQPNYGYHPGFAWAARREAIDHLGGLFDVGILGAADNHMARGLVGTAPQSLFTRVSKGYFQAVEEWQRRATTHIRGNVGYVPGSIQHHFHGHKVDRRYLERWDIIRRYNFDPNLDLKRDWQGVLAFTERGERMRNSIRRYFNERFEDAT